MVSDKKVFIIVVTYNGMEWISRCLESTRPYPVMIVDNCSTDGTLEYVKSNYPDIILIEQKENLGFGKANNIGISYALNNNADFVFLLNQDAFLKTQTLQKLVETSLRNPEYGILSPIHLNGKGKNLEEVFLYYIKKESNSLLSDLLLNKDLKDVYSIAMVNAAAWLIPKKTLERVGGFQPAFFLYGEDDNYCQRVFYHNLKIGVCPNIFILHDSNNNYHVEQEKGSKKYFEKFLNNIKIEYADVNADNRIKFKKLKLYYFKEALISALFLDFKDSRINLKKWRTIRNLNFIKEVESDRKSGKHYLFSS